jgi:hypothetical protein
MPWEEETERESRKPELSPLIEAFRDQLRACLEECAAGRRGLFTDLGYLAREHLAREHLGGNEGNNRSWPEAAQLRELAFALQSILAQSGEDDALCDQFLDLCSIHGESDPGEPRLARAFLNEIAGKH